MVIAIDIDGILTKEIEGYSEEEYTNRTPNFSNIGWVHFLQQQGHEIYLYTARHEEDRAITEKWLQTWNVPWDHLVMGKLHYDILIDDKAYNGMIEMVTKNEDIIM